MISVLMTIFNEPIEWVSISILSIMKQSYTDFELIVIVDNPEYSYMAELQKLIMHLNKPNLRIIYNHTNLGLVNSLNKAFSLSRGAYIARMDSDDVADSSHLEHQISFLQDNSLDFVSSSVNLINEDGIKIESSNLSRNLFPKDINKLEKIGNFFWHPTWLMKSVVMQKLNGYRNIPSVEDYDFVVRAILLGFRLGQNHSASVNKRISEKSISSLDNYRQTMYTEAIRSGYRTGIQLEIPTDLPAISALEQKKFLHFRASIEHKPSLESRIKLILLLPWSKNARILFHTKIIYKLGPSLLLRTSISSNLIFSFLVHT